MIAFLSALNVIFWGLCVKDVGGPSFTPSFVLKLCFNKYFVLALSSAFLAALLRYSIIERRVLSSDINCSHYASLLLHFRQKDRASRLDWNRADYGRNNSFSEGKK